MSRVSAPPPGDLEGPPTVAGATLAFSAALTFALLGGVLFLPWVIGRWCSAIVAARMAPQARRAWRAGRTMVSGLAFLCVVFAPPIAILFAMASQRGDAIGSAQVIGPVGMTLALVPLFLRAPLVLAADERVTLIEAASRSIAHAIADPITTVRLTVLLVGVATLTVGLALPLASATNGFVALVVTLAVIPVVLTGVMWVVASHTPRDAPPVRAWMLGVLVIALGLPAFLLVLAAGLATSEPRALTVLTDGTGRQLVRGLLDEEGPRGSIEAEGFSIAGGLHGVVVQRSDGSSYEVASRYEPSLALMRSTPCDGLHALLFPQCRRVQLSGPDWEMELLVDEGGARLDDGAIDRASERLGIAGLVALVVACLVAVAVIAALARSIATSRRVSGRDRALRLGGVLELADTGAIDGSGRVVGPSNRVTLHEGGVVLRLPDSVLAVGVASSAREAAVRRHDVIVACDRVPGIITHRTADAPWPSEASLVIGEPAVIETESIARVQRSLTRWVLVGVTSVVVAHAALASA